MGKLLPLIRMLLVELVERIDDGRCDATDEQEERLLVLLQGIVDGERRVSKYAACRYLNMSRSKFDALVRAGVLPKGRKEAGWKELSWRLSELDKWIDEQRKHRLKV